jgi:hypothetical protein
VKKMCRLTTVLVDLDTFVPDHQHYQQNHLGTLLYNEAQGEDAMLDDESCRKGAETEV